MESQNQCKVLQFGGEDSASRLSDFLRFSYFFMVSASNVLVIPRLRLRVFSGQLMVYVGFHASLSVLVVVMGNLSWMMRIVHWKLLLLMFTAIPFFVVTAKAYREI